LTQSHRPGEPPPVRRTADRRHGRGERRRRSAGCAGRV